MSSCCWDLLSTLWLVGIYEYPEKVIGPPHEIACGECKVSHSVYNIFFSIIRSCVAVLYPDGQ